MYNDYKKDPHIFFYNFKRLFFSFYCQYPEVISGSLLAFEELNRQFLILYNTGDTKLEKVMK